MESTKMKKSNWHGGKGSTHRTDTSSKQYQDNWDKIFGKKPKENNLNNAEFPQRKNINTRGK